MALQKQVVPIKISGGIDTKTDPDQVIPGRLLTLENGIYTSLERIKKRNGYAALSASIEGSLNSITQGAALATFKNELNLFTGVELYSYSESTARWSDKGTAASFSISSKPVIRNTYQQTTADAAQHSSGLQLFTWEDSSGGSRYSIIDSITGETVVSNALITSTAIKPKPFAIGNFLVIFYIEPVLHHLKIKTFAITNPSVLYSTLTASTTVNIANQNYDACATSTRVYFSYNSTTGIGVNFITSTLGLGTQKTELGESASSCIAVTVDQPLLQMWVAYHNGTEIKYFIHDGNPSLVSVLAPTLISSNSNTINNITLYANNGSGKTFYTQNAAATYNNFIIEASLTQAGVVSGVTTLIRSVGIAAKPFAYNNEIYLTIAFETTLQPTYFIINTANTDVVAKFSPGVGGGLLKKNIVPEVVNIGTGLYLIPSLQKDLFTTISGAVYTQTGVTVATLDFITNESFISAELGENLLFAGGILYMYDGISVVEHNFHIYPENITASSTGSGGVGAGQYQYAITYEWMDNQGQIQYSAPSVPVQITITGTKHVDLVIPTLRITAKKAPTRAPVTIGIYRTEANGTTFYKVTNVTSPVFNDTTVDTINYTDALADSAIIGNPLLYTTGGVLENIAAPAADYITTYKDRAIVLPSENKNQWWPSKQVVPGVPVEFSDALAQNVDQAGGNMVAVARLDSVLVLFKQYLLYYVTGTGPDATGAQNDFSDPQPIACDGGLLDKKSIVLTPAGLMYKSQKGIYLLSRSLSVQYIGADVEAYNGATIISADLIADTTQVRFCLDTGIVLMYDYFVQRWGVFTNHNAVDSLIFQGLYTYLQPNGLVLRETPGQFKDSGRFIKLKLTTSWLSFSGLQAFQRVYKLILLGEYLNPHNLTVNVAYDFNPYATQESLIQVGALLGTPNYGDDAFYGDTSPYGGAFPLYEFNSNLARQKCTSIQITMEDEQTVGFGENLAISGLAFEVGLKKSTNLQDPSRSFS